MIPAPTSPHIVAIFHPASPYTESHLFGPYNPTILSHLFRPYNPTILRHLTLFGVSSRNYRTWTSTRAVVRQGGAVMVIAALTGQTATQKISRLAGFPDEYAQEVIDLTDQELAARKLKRIQQYGFDPDEIYFTPKTPKKKKGSDELSRLTDKQSKAADIQFDDSKWSKAFKERMALLESKNGGVGGSGTKKGGTVTFADLPPPATMQERDQLVVKIEQELLEKPAGGGSGGPLDGDLSEYSDYEHDDAPTLDEMIARVEKHPSFRPTLETTTHLDSTQKRKLTTAYNKVHADQPLSLAKPSEKSSKGKKRGRK
ncbi:hypothetical protein DM02DRAFT_636361 [Periconia macrospinosa]|uniref:Uncharacterized protein n=1 Tax=Periconia macrospinosa TaxID=97972 RepID=A0A2V1D0E2_9PLEO|nr:hypothetical protein DM02DRAFT_636361 [Periconia macrospinosa]